MLSYRHGFHAGNWADVQKHTALALLLGHLRRKDKPFCILDAFAGDGIYDLAAPEAVKTGEFHEGIERLWQRRDAPAGADWYLEQVRAVNPGEVLERYPGSPALARAALRQADRLILGELHPASYRALKRWAAGDRRIALHRRDGIEFLDALVPPPVRRGLVLVDPAYEVKDEYEKLPVALARAMGKWREGIYALWYPVLPAGKSPSNRRRKAFIRTNRFIKRFRNTDTIPLILSYLIKAKNTIFSTHLNTHITNNKTIIN